MRPATQVVPNRVMPTGPAVVYNPQRTGIMPIPKLPRMTVEDALKRANSYTAGYIADAADRNNKNIEDLTFAEFDDYTKRFLAAGVLRNYETYLADAMGNMRSSLPAFMEYLFYRNKDALVDDYNQAVAVYTQAHPVMQQYSTDDLEYFRILLEDYIKAIAEYNGVNLADVTLADFHNFLKLARNTDYLRFADDVAKYYGLTTRALERVLFEQAKYTLTYQ